MGFTSGTREVGEDTVPLCAVPPNGVRVKNRGGSVIYVGGPDVQAAGDGQGYPVDPGESEEFTAPVAKESPVVPAPPGDMDPAVLYARTAAGTGISRVSFISAAMT